MVVTPSEIVYWEILPAIRREMVVQMKDRGLKQKDIADLLEVTPSAISQYLAKKRGEFEFTDIFRKQIKAQVEFVIDESMTPFEATNSLIKQFERSREICIVCREKNNVAKDCNVCFEN